MSFLIQFFNFLFIMKMFYNKMLKIIYVDKNLYLWEVDLVVELEPFGLYTNI